MLSLIFGKKKKKVMMIDDDLRVLNSLSAILKSREDIEFIAVSSKKDFLDNIDKVDAVVSDYHMVDVTGITFEKVRVLCDAKKIPLLLLTGDIYPYYDYQESKPASAKTIIAGIEKMLSRGYIPSSKKAPKVA